MTWMLFAIVAAALCSTCFAVPGAEPEPPDAEKDVSGDAIPPEKDAEPETAEPEQKEPEAEAQEPEADPFDADSLDLARMYGLTEEQARSFNTPVEMEKFLIRREAMSRHAQPPQRPADLPSEQKQERKRLTVDDLGLSEEVSDEVRDGFKKIIDLYEDRLDRVEQVSGSVDNRVSEQAAVAAEQLFDSRIASLGESYVPFVGSGATRTLAAGTPESNARVEIAMNYAAIKRGYLANGWPLPDEEKLFQRAVYASLGPRLKDDIKKQARGEVRDQLKKKASQAIGRADGRSPKDLSPLDRAIAKSMALDRKLDEVNANAV